VISSDYAEIMKGPPLDPEQTVRAWHQTLNAGELDRLLALSAADVEVGGPRGSGRGRDLLRAWFGRADIRLEPISLQTHGEAVVVEQQAGWPGDTEPQRVASVFRVRDGLVTSVIRYPDVTAALESIDRLSEA
jgi:ketosteroid isomerase-like protein